MIIRDRYIWSRTFVKCVKCKKDYLRLDKCRDKVNKCMVCTTGNRFHHVSKSEVPKLLAIERLLNEDKK